MFTVLNIAKLLLAKAYDL